MANQHEFLSIIGFFLIPSIPMSSGYEKIVIAGGDTDKPLAMEKRLKIIDRYIHNPERARKFLDCGCGAGSYVATLLDRFGLDAHGIEYESKKVDQAHLHSSLRDRVRQGDLQALDFPSDYWDYALLNEVLEHVPDERQVLNEIYRVLKPGGYLFVFSPNRWFPFETHGVRFKNSNRQVPYLTPFIPYLPLKWGNIFFNYWARNYWPWELRKLVEEGHFSVIDRYFISLTFENISRRQPGLIKFSKSFLRRVGNAMENIPILKYFGVTQVLVCRKQPFEDS